MTNTIISQTLRRFRISSRSSDNTLGIFAATCSRDAVLALAREAGHDSIEQMAGVSGETTDEFLAGLSVFDVDAPDADDRFIVDDGDGDTVNLRANVEQLEAQGYHFVSYADGSWNVISPADERGLRATKRYASLFDAVTLNGGAR